MVEHLDLWRLARCAKLVLKLQLVRSDYVGGVVKDVL